MDSLKVLDPERPIREADVLACPFSADFVAEVGAQCRGILNRLFFEVVSEPPHWSDGFDARHRHPQQLCHARGD